MSFTYQYPHPAVTTDVVLFTIRNERLELLLIQRNGEPYKGCWALPGGFLEIDEDLETGARRELAEETAISDVYLEQLCSVGTPGRDPRERVISVVYYGMAPADKLHIRADSDAADARWYDMAELPRLAFDHQWVVQHAYERLTAKMEYSTIMLQFMGEKFTLSELQTTYEVVLGEAQDKRNFRKRILAMDCIEETGETSRGGNHRPAMLYQAKQPNNVEYIKRNNGRVSPATEATTSLEKQA